MMITIREKEKKKQES